MVSQKHPFWQALVSAILIFGIGLLLGIFLEDSRSRDIEFVLLNSEINAFDQQLTQQIGSNFKVDCAILEKNLIKLTDKVYEEAKLLEKYDSVSDLTNTLKAVHRKYDLLRTMLWIQSKNLKETCNPQFITIVYLYQYEKPEINIRSTQTAFSRFLVDLKEKYGNRILLIPIAADLNLNSLNLIKEAYSINSYPAVIVNEDKVITTLEELGEIEKTLDKNALLNLLSRHNRQNYSLWKA